MSSLTSKVSSLFKPKEETFSSDYVLTYDTWSDYLYSRDQTKYSESMPISELERKFSHIESCDEITKNFFAIPEESRQCIVHLIELGLSHAEIIAYTNIFHRMKRVYPKVEAHKLLFRPGAYDGCKGYSPKISGEFWDATYKFVNFQKRTSNRIIWKWAASSRTPFFLLIPIYGEQRIIDAIDLWVEESFVNDCIDDFIMLLERFDDLDSDYPFSWMMGVLNSDIRTRLQMVTR